MRAWLVVLLVLFATTAGAEPVAVETTEDASCEDDGPCVALSIWGDAYCGNTEEDRVWQAPCVVGSGTGDARCTTPGVAQDGTTCIVASAGGDASCESWDYWDGTHECVAVAADGDAECHNNGPSAHQTCVALSGTGNATCTASPWTAHSCLLVSGTGDTRCGTAWFHEPPECLAVSALGDADGDVAVSVFGDATCAGIGWDAAVPCVAVSILGNANGTVAASGTGDASQCTEQSCRGGFIIDRDQAFGVIASAAHNDCGAQRCADVNATGDANGSLVAVSGTGNATASCDGHWWLGPSQHACIGASGTGNATGRVAASGTGDAESTCNNYGVERSALLPGLGHGDQLSGGTCAAASGTGEAWGSSRACDRAYPERGGGYGWLECDDTTDVAVSGTGDASGRVAASGTGETRACDTGYEQCRSGIVSVQGSDVADHCAWQDECESVRVNGDAEGGTAVSATAQICTGRDECDQGIAASGIWQHNGRVTSNPATWQDALCHFTGLCL